jgi:hypothetical protein
MNPPDFPWEIRSEHGEHTLFIDGHPVTGPFATPDEVQTEFQRLARLIEAARLVALRSVVERRGTIEPPAVRPVLDPRSGDGCAPQRARNGA